ncbi:LADA_0B05226g1_1 [Lachancea dasiensis]|uniref:LADA_0B05226g1_1 n=1 Tax=Lachancea dasiensis TaxID=1072105 RepID=A0A1G4ITB0_9SACH|nr:LADA_0B05226g1_1 [Lachancea dasiensis]
MQERKVHIRIQEPTSLNMPDKLVIVMVGLPARGKSYIAQQIVSYYQDAFSDSSSCRLFNAGKERRSMAINSLNLAPVSKLYRTITRQPRRLDDERVHHDHMLHSSPEDSDGDDDAEEGDGEVGHLADKLQSNLSLLTRNPVPPEMLFDTENNMAVSARQEIALATLLKMCIWLETEISHRVAIFDATNTTVDRRSMIVDTVRSHTSSTTPIIFIESICNDAAIIHKNIVHKVNHSPDYMDKVDKEWCFRDFEARLENYERVYEPCDIEKEFPEESFICQIRVIDQGSSLPLRGHASLLHESALMRLLHEVYNNSLRPSDSLPRALDSITKAHSSCSSSSSSLFSMPDPSHSVHALELEKVDEHREEAEFEQKELQKLSRRVYVSTSKTVES